MVFNVPLITTVTLDVTACWDTHKNIMQLESLDGMLGSASTAPIRFKIYVYHATHQKPTSAVHTTLLPDPS